MTAGNDKPTTTMNLKRLKITHAIIAIGVSTSAYFNNKGYLSDSIDTPITIIGAVFFIWFVTADIIILRRCKTIWEGDELKLIRKKYAKQLAWDIFCMTVLVLSVFFRAVPEEKLKEMGLA